MTAMKANTPWLVLFGTHIAIVRAGSGSAAFTKFKAQFSPNGGKMGRIVPPDRSEVTIRQPTEKDRGWIEDSGDPAFLLLLPELVPA